MEKEKMRLNRKPITFNPIILQVMEDVIDKRGGLTSYSALINEVLAEKFAKEIQVKELELKGNPSNS